METKTKWIVGFIVLVILAGISVLFSGQTNLFKGSLSALGQQCNPATPAGSGAAGSCAAGLVCNPNRRVCVPGAGAAPQPPAPAPQPTVNISGVNATWIPAQGGFRITWNAEGVTNTNPYSYKIFLSTVSLQNQNEQHPITELNRENANYHTRTTMYTPSNALYNNRYCFTVVPMKNPNERFNNGSGVCWDRPADWIVYALRSPIRDPKTFTVTKLASARGERIQTLNNVGKWNLSSLNGNPARIVSICFDLNGNRWMQIQPNYIRAVYLRDLAHRGVIYEFPLDKIADGVCDEYSIPGGIEIPAGRSNDMWVDVDLNITNIPNGVFSFTPIAGVTQAFSPQRGTGTPPMINSPVAVRVSTQQ